MTHESYTYGLHFNTQGAQLGRPSFLACTYQLSEGRHTARATAVRTQYAEM